MGAYGQLQLDAGAVPPAPPARPPGAAIAHCGIVSLTARARPALVCRDDDEDCRACTPMRLPQGSMCLAHGGMAASVGGARIHRWLCVACRGGFCAADVQHINEYLFKLSQSDASKRTTDWRRRLDFTHACKQVRSRRSIPIDSLSLRTRPHIPSPTVPPRTRWFCARSLMARRS